MPQGEFRGIDLPEATLAEDVEGQRINDVELKLCYYVEKK